MSVSITNGSDGQTYEIKTQVEITWNYPLWGKNIHYQRYQSHVYFFLLWHYGSWWNQNDWHWLLHTQQASSYEWMYVYVCVQSQAFGLRQFSNQQVMNIRSFKITQKRASGGHLVNRCLWMILSPCSLLVSISKTELYLSDRKRWKNRNNHFNCSIVLSGHLSPHKTPSVYITSRIRHYTSTGLMNVISQDFRTELLFVFDHWCWTPPRRTTTNNNIICEPSAHTVQENGKVRCRGNSAAKKALIHSSWI